MAHQTRRCTLAKQLAFRPFAAIRREPRSGEQTSLDHSEPDC